MMLCLDTAEEFRRSLQRHRDASGLPLCDELASSQSLRSAHWLSVEIFARAFSTSSSPQMISYNHPSTRRDRSLITPATQEPSLWALFLNCLYKYSIRGRHIFSLLRVRAFPIRPFRYPLQLHTSLQYVQRSPRRCSQGKIIDVFSSHEHQLK